MQVQPEEPAVQARQQPLKASLKPVKHRRVSGGAHSTSSTEGISSNTADSSHSSLPQQVSVTIIIVLLAFHILPILFAKCV